MYPNTQLFIDGAGWTPPAGRTLRSSIPPPARRSARSRTPARPTSTGRSPPPRRASRPGKKVSAYRALEDHAQGRRPDARARRRRSRALMTHGAGQAARRGQGRDPARRRHHRVVRRGRQARLRPRHPGARRTASYQLVVKEPVGPVAAFTPWNFPINQVVRKIVGRAGRRLLDRRQGARGNARVAAPS